MHLEILDYLDWVLLAGSAAGCLYLWYACHAVARFVQRPRPQAAPCPPASILKPLAGADPALAANLRSFCRQDYPAFQIVFGLATEADPAAAAARAMIAEFPGRDLALVIEPARSGANLKIANLRNMLPRARHDFLVIADSDMRVGPDYLAAVAAPLADPEIGLVTCLYRGISAGGLWSDLACLHINHAFLPQAVVGEALGQGAGCFGATMALSRATLERAGGFAALADRLADDHVLGAEVRRLGLRVELSPYLVDDHVAEPGLGALFAHELRWARTIRLIAPKGFAGSIVTHPVGLAVLALLLGQEPGPAGAVLALALAARFYGAFRIERALGLRSPRLWLLPVRDLLSLGVFAASFLGRTVAWRGGKFRVAADGRLAVRDEGTG